MRNSCRGLLLQSWTVTSLLALASGAHAELEVCNTTTQDLLFATTMRHTADLGSTAWGSFYPCSENEAWDDMGWFSIPSCSCRQVWSGDARGQVFHWTALSGDTVWGSSDPNAAETWPVPRQEHQECSSTVSQFCRINNICPLTPHWLSSSRFRGFTIFVNPNNTFGDGQSCDDVNRGSDVCLGIDLGEQCNRR